MEIQNILLEGLRKHNQKNTLETLGDRSQYVGSSDIGYCLKQACLSKINPNEALSLKQLLVFERGHLAEKILENALQAENIAFETQKTIRGAGEYDFIQTHIDFYLPHEDMIIEVKTSNSIPEHPYDAWIQQIQLQMGIGGIKKAKILCFDLNTGQIREYGAFDFNPSVFQLCASRAKQIFAFLKEEKILPKGEIGTLCSYCSFRTQCTEFTAQAQEVDETIAQKVENLKILQTQHKEADNRIKAEKQNLLEFCQNANITKIVSDNASLSVISTAGKTFLDNEKIKEIIPEDMLHLFLKQGQSYKSLKIT